MYWTEFLTVALVHMLAVASPGPDFAIVLRESVSNGRHAGIWTALGVGSGILLHVGYCLLGIGLIVSQSIVLFNLLKWLAAAYLIYIGIRALQARPADPAANATVGAGGLWPLSGLGHRCVVLRSGAAVQPGAGASRLCAPGPLV